MGYFPYFLFDRIPALDYENLKLPLSKGKYFKHVISEIYPIIDDLGKMVIYGNIGKLYTSIDLEISCTNNIVVEIGIKEIFDYFQILIGYGSETFYVYRGYYMMKAYTKQEKELRIGMVLEEFLNEMFIYQPITETLESYPEELRA